MSRSSRPPSTIRIDSHTVAIGLMALAVTGVFVLVVAFLIVRGQHPPEINLMHTATPGNSTAVIGQILEPTASPTFGTRTHVVVEGETLIGIANAYGVPINAIIEINRLQNPGMLTVGQTLLIPDPFSLTPTVPYATPTSPPTSTLEVDDPLALSLLSGWPRSTIDGDLAANYPLTLETPRMRIHYQPGTYPESHINELRDLLDQALTNVETRLGTRLNGMVDIYLAGTLFEGDDATLRGSSLSKDRQTFILADGSGTAYEMSYFVTHELTHLVAWNTWGSPSSTMLSEGLATWDGRRELEEGGAVPYEQICLGLYAANQLPDLPAIDRTYQVFQGHIQYRFNYFASACFVDYLVQTYGLEAFSRLYHTSDYQDIYGKSMGELTSDWRAWLASRRSELFLDPGTMIQETDKVTRAYEAVLDTYDGSRTMHSAYGAIDKARTALWRGDYLAVDAWLRQVYVLLGYQPG